MQIDVYGRRNFLETFTWIATFATVDIAERTVAFWESDSPNSMEFVIGLENTNA